ncbi:MAG: DNA-processing protein DprA [Candidatus Dormibacteria bacterium]
MSSVATETPPGWRACVPGTPGYPVLLAQLSAPPRLALRGTLEAQEVMVAVVGARRLTAYGEDLAYEIAGGIAAAGVTVVSGMARGIDGAAHRGALDAGGRTVAVMGTGPDCLYPPEHRGLADRIAESGALLTQFPLGTPPHRGNFPTRNATISGLCLGVVVIEARRRSGAMLTAGAGGDQGRIVMAVPGSVHNPASRGCHDLIRDGAILVTSAAEVLEAVRPDGVSEMVLPGVEEPAGRAFGDTRDEVVAVLECGSLTLDEIVAAVRDGPTEAVAAVARLRLDGFIRLRDGAYCLAATANPRNKAVRNRVV